MAIGPPEGAPFLPSLTLLVFFIIKSSEINAHRRRVNVWINGQQTKRNFSIFIQAGDFRRSNNVELPGSEHGSSCIMYSGNSAINAHPAPWRPLGFSCRWAGRGESTNVYVGWGTKRGVTLCHQCSCASVPPTESGAGFSVPAGRALGRSFCWGLVSQPCSKTCLVQWCG